MSNVTLKNKENEDNAKSHSHLGMHMPSFDEFFDKFTHNWPFSRPSSLNRVESSEFTLNPKVDIVEDETCYKLTAELPGLENKDISLDLSDGVLTMSGEKKTEKKEEKQGNYHLMERSYGYFKRSFVLPSSVEESKINADFKKGILSVVMPKSEKAQQKQRKIKIDG